MIDYLKDYDPKTVVLAYAELKKRNYQIPEKLTKKLEQFCSDWVQPDMETFLKVYLSKDEKEYLNGNDDSTLEESFDKETEFPNQEKPWYHSWGAFMFTVATAVAIGMIVATYIIYLVLNEKIGKSF